MARRTGLGLVGVLAALAMSGVARANPEPMSVYDGRSIAMGGTGVADNDSIAAVVLNPANLDLIKKFTATLDFTGISPKYTAPQFPPAMTPSQMTTGTKVTPLFLAGGAYRIFDPLVVGLAAYIANGSGAAYNDSNKFTIGQLEVSLPISYRIVDGLSIAVQPRFGYAVADVTLPTLGSPTSGSLNGTAWGVTAGINWRPIESLKLGLAYRSEMDFTLKGALTVPTPPMGAPGTFDDSSANFNTPNTVRLGAAWSILKDLTVTPEVRWANFAQSNKARIVTVNFPAPPAGPGPQSRTQEQDWKNAWTGALGAEYRLGILALRAGTSVGGSATPSTTQTPFDVPPGTIVSVGGGVGVQVVDTLQIDAGVFDQWGSYNVTNDNPMDGSNGEYSLNAFFFALSATLRI